jgi:hypothetical protein
VRLTGYGPLGVTRRHRLAIHNDSALPSHGALEGISKFLVFSVQVLGHNYAALLLACEVEFDRQLLRLASPCRRQCLPPRAIRSPGILARMLISA